MASENLTATLARLGRYETIEGPVLYLCGNVDDEHIAKRLGLIDAEVVITSARRLVALERVVEAVKRWQKVPPDIYAIKAAVDEIDTALAALDEKEVDRG